MSLVLTKPIAAGLLGPSSATDNQLLRFDGTTGHLVQVCPGITVDDSGHMTSAGNILASIFDTNVAAAGVTLSGTTLAADGTDVNIDINITPKGTGEVNLCRTQIVETSAMTSGSAGVPAIFIPRYDAPTSQRSAFTVIQGDPTSALGANGTIIHTRNRPFGFSTENKEIDEIITRIDLFIKNDGSVGIGEIAPETLVEMTSTAPYLTLHNSTEEDTDGGRESIIQAFGEQSGGEETTLVKMTMAHDGAADDQKGYWALATNDGTDGDAPTERLKVDSTGLVTTQGVIRGTTSLWYRTEHSETASLDPGASGATWTGVDANTLGGYQLDAAGETLHAHGDIHSDWDAASDIEVKVAFEVNVDNSAGNAGDTVDLQCIAYYKGTGDTANKTQTQEEAVTVGACAQYTSFVCTFTLNYDEAGNVIEQGDKMTLIVNLETDTSEVDDIIVNHIHLRYKTKQLSVEV